MIPCTRTSRVPRFSPRPMAGTGASSTWRRCGAACALTETPDLILLDLTLPDARGLDTLHRLRERFAFVPVVLLTAVEDPDIEATALKEGAQDFLGKDELTARTLRRVVRYAMERHHRQQDLMRLATRDELTGLFNRRGFLAAAEPLARAAERADRTFLVFFADLDGLNAINDTHGHQVGDEAIRDAAWILTHSFRSADLIARIGGDEFAIFAPDAPPETIEIMIRRVTKWQAERNARARSAVSGVAQPGWRRVDGKRAAHAGDDALRSGHGGVRGEAALTPGRERSARIDIAVGHSRIAVRRSPDGDARLLPYLALVLRAR